MKLDILAIAIHPDDIELAASGTLISHIKQGYSVGILDLSEGELGTRGTPELRKEEAHIASEVMGLKVREILNIPDGFFRNTPDNQLLIAKYIRKFKPEIVLANSIHDRHPDHGRASKMIREACFISGLVKVETTIDHKAQAPWRPKHIYYYIQDYNLEADLVVDISTEMDQKMEAIKAFKSQFFNEDSNEPNTPISDASFLEYIRGRGSVWGRSIGKEYGEGYKVERTIGTRDLFNLL